MAGPVHFEVFVRKTPQAAWALDSALEHRNQALQLADDLLADKQAVSVRVTKETLNVQTMEFQSVTLLTKGAPEPPRRKVGRDDHGPVACATPPDLYTSHARERIGRVLDDWLVRQGVTPFELLHRPDLIEMLDASGMALQHALQKIAVPESQTTGQPVHDVIRRYQRLVDQAIDRVLRTGRNGGFADLSVEPLADVARRVISNPDRAFLLGGAVAQAMAKAQGWRAKFDVLMDLTDTAPEDSEPAALVHVVIEQAASEILSLRRARAEVLGGGLDLGGQLATLVRLAVPKEAQLVARADARVAAVLPVLEGPALRLGRHMANGHYRLLAAGLSRRVLAELMGPRRLRPSDPNGEIDVLRAMAMILTAAAGKFLTLEEAQLAFAERSKTLVAADFVEAYVGSAPTPLAEADLLVRLCENVTGAGAKRSASTWLVACVTALRFERAIIESGLGAGARLMQLAELQSRVRACDLAEEDQNDVCEALSRIGDAVESQGRVSAQIARASAPLTQRLSLLLRMAIGQACPIGPAADRARAEVLKLLKSPETRSSLATDPDALPILKPLMRAAGLAA